MDALTEAHALYERSGGTTANPNRPPAYKAVGLTLAIASGIFIGTSFVLKKTGLLKANAKYNEEAGEGYGYLKNAYWWTGMTLMIIGEICNFVAYAFVDAILVTPLGALSVVITTILSAIFLKERLSFVGKVGCFNCIIGSIIIVMNAPQQSAVSDIQEMKHFVISPGFLSYAGVIILVCAFIAFWAGPRYGKKSMLVYLSICSLIGGLSVVATQGLGSAIVAQAGGKPQFNQWFLYLLLVFVVVTLVTEIIFLNKALNLFNAALVTPTYYVFFTSATIVTSAILFRGFKGTPIAIATMIMGFLQICAGVVLLQLSKSAKDVPDAAVFKGDLDQVRTVAEQEQPESEPKADAIRGAAAIIRRFSVSRQKMEHEEARRLYDEKMRDEMEPIGENEIVEWDGLRRRRTIIGESPIVPLQRRKTIHPPLGMSHFPSETEEEESPATDGDHRDRPGVFENFRNRASTVLTPGHRNSTRAGQTNVRSPMHPVPLTEITIGAGKSTDPPTTPYSHEEAQEHIYGLPEELRATPADRADTPRSIGWGRNRGDSFRGEEGGSLAPTPPSHRTSRRQFSFQNVFHRARADGGASPGVASARPPTASSQDVPPPSRKGMGSRQSSKEQANALKTATEEERLGLVKGDSHAALYSQQHSTSPTRLPSLHKSKHHYSSSSDVDIVEEYEYEHELDSPDVAYHDRDNDSEEDWQIENKPPRPPMHTTPPRTAQPPTTVTDSKTLPNITTRGSPPLPPLPLKTSSRSSPSAPVGLPAHPAVNVSPEREWGVPPVDELGGYGRWDQQQNQQPKRMFQQQSHQLHSTQQQQVTQQNTQERNITGTGPNKLRKKPRREGSEASNSSVEERELKDYEARSGRRGGDGAFI